MLACGGHYEYNQSDMALYTQYSLICIGTMLEYIPYFICTQTLVSQYSQTLVHNLCVPSSGYV